MLKLAGLTVMLGIAGSQLKDEFAASFMFNQHTAECGKFMDKHLEGAVAKIDQGIKEMQSKYPGI
jgi:hypothetical protein